MVSLESLGPSPPKKIIGLKLVDLKQKELDGCCLCPASHLNKRLACIGLRIYIMCMYMHDYACVYIYIYTTMYIYNCIVYVYIYKFIYIYILIYTQPNLMREDDCTYMFVDNFLFMAGQLRNVSVMDAVLCPASHLSKRRACIGLHSYVYIYIHICVYIYIMCMYIHDYACVYIYIYTQLQYVYIQLCIVYIYICTNMIQYVYIYIYIYSYILNQI